MLFIKESNNALLDHIRIEDQEEIILNGIPSEMCGFLQVSNGLEDAVKVRTLTLSGQEDSIEKRNLNISWKLSAGEKKLAPINFALDSDTPPGEYIRFLEIGGKKQRVKLIVQPNVEVDIYPTTFTLQNTVPGTLHTLIFTVTNIGNVRFQIPEVKHIGALDMDLMCRAFGFAFRDEKSRDFNSTLNSITDNIKQNLTDWASAKVREAGQMLEPGKNMLVHLQFSIPKNADRNSDYSGNVRFWDKDLSFVIKSHSEAKPKKQTS